MNKIKLLLLAFAVWVSATPALAADDITGDGNWSMTDATTLISYLLGNNPSPCNVSACDVNGSGDVSMSDVTDLIRMLLAGETPQHATYDQFVTSKPALWVPNGDHIFVRQTAEGAAVLDADGNVQDNKVLFTDGSLQQVNFWMDDSHILADPTYQTAELIAKSVKFMNADFEECSYNEITYASLQFQVYVPARFEAVKAAFRGDRCVKTEGYSHSCSLSQKENVTIDGVEYNNYQVVVFCGAGGQHLSGSAYDTTPLLGPDAGSVCSIRLKDTAPDSAAVAGQSIGSMFIANQSLSIVESLESFFEGYVDGNTVYDKRTEVKLYSSAVARNLAAEQIVSTKYYNLAGEESEKPFQDMNIEVVTYGNGETTARKVLK